jgi:hypothetical protein
MVYEVIIIDKIFCESFINWTYEENSDTAGRMGLLNLQLKSAMKKANGESCILAISPIIQEELEQKYNQDDRGMCHLSSLLEVTEELKIPPCFDEADSIIKGASLLKWKEITFCILTGNSLIYDRAKKYGFDVFQLKDSEKVLNLTT